MFKTYSLFYHKSFMIKDNKLKWFIRIKKIKISKNSKIMKYITYFSICIVVNHEKQLIKSKNKEWLVLNPDYNQIYENISTTMFFLKRLMLDI
jgi:hypothetical protein